LVPSQQLKTPSNQEINVQRTWEFVQKKVASGYYSSVSEVVREGLRLLKEKDLLLEARLQALRGGIQKGIDQAEAGELLDGQEVMKELRKILKMKRG